MIPQISVVMPVFNEERYVASAIESILNQTFADFEFIIIDDGSTDDSCRIIESYCDKRISFFRSENKGMGAQFNFGIENSEAPLIARMDADDISVRNRFELQLNALSKKPEVHVLGTNVLFINENGLPICKKKYPENHNDIEFVMPIESSVCHPSVIMRKEVLYEVGLYQTKYSYAADHALFLEIISRGFKFYNIQNTLLKYRPRFIRKDLSRMKGSSRVSYKLGVEYLNKLRMIHSEFHNEYNYNFRMALIEYYRGSLAHSRRYLFKALSAKKYKVIIILRYMVITLLGQHTIDLLRKNILTKLNLYLNRMIKIDTHRIRN